MRMRLLVVLAAGLLVGSDPAPDLGEVARPSAFPAGSRWLDVIDGSTWEFGKDGVLRMVEADGGRVLIVRCAIDREASPPRIDITDSRKITMKGIYRVEGAYVLVCFHDLGVKTRPTRFTRKGRAIIVILQRLK